VFVKKRLLVELYSTCRPVHRTLQGLSSYFPVLQMQKAGQSPLPGNGCRAETLPEIPDAQVNELISPILEHIRGVICSTDEEAEYFLARLAQQVQHPAHKSGVDLMITTTNKNPFPLEASDARFVVFECNDSRKGDFAYFENLAAHLNDKTARAFYQFLLKFDLSDYGCFKAKRPETQTLRHPLKIPAFYNFLSYECINCAGGAPEACESAAMFDKFKKWAGDAKFELVSYTATKFRTDFNSLMKKVESGVDTKRTAKGHAYTINWTKLESCLKRHGLFTANV
jgi:hypothetical protein